MQFAPRTLNSEKRYYLIEIEKKTQEALITSDIVSSVIKNSYQTVFGINEVNPLFLEVHDFDSNQYIISTDVKTSVALRSALIIPPEHSIIISFRVLSESSTLQALYHDSRLYFKPLI